MNIEHETGINGKRTGLVHITLTPDEILTSAIGKLSDALSEMSGDPREEVELSLRRSAAWAEGRG